MTTTDNNSGGSIISDRFSRLKQATIMMVDDEPIMIDIIQALLEDEGYSDFITLVDSSETIATMSLKKPDVLLLDLDMPKVDGYTILEQIRAIPEYMYLPVIILTATSESDSKLRVLELGATDFLAKPVDPSELALRLRNTLVAKAYQDQLAFYDNLTGLPNRQFFNDRLQWGLKQAKRENKPIAIMDIGLDRFRQINDTLGPNVGDEVLKIVSQRLTDVVRDSDVVTRGSDTNIMNHIARLGGDEFSIMLCGVHSADNAALVATRLLDSLQQPIILENNEIFLSAGIGIAVYPDDGEEIDTLIKHAGAARDHAKQQGYGHYQYFSKDMNAHALKRLSMESKLRRALENNELELYYQPKVNTQTGEVVGMEALLRWFNEEDGSIMPVDFIPFAEDLGLIVPIGEWIFMEACMTTQAWVDEGYDNLKISVNVSGKQFADAGLRDAVKKALDTSGLDPSRLVLEMTESMMMGDVENNIKVLNDIKELGISYSIDDFGTGYSSLAYLKQFPIDELKIDRSFLIDVPSNKDDVSIVNAILAMAKSLDLTVVAEGVEEVPQLDFLRDAMCDIIQGFYFSKPLTKGDFTDYLGNQNSLLTRQQ